MKKFLGLLLIFVSSLSMADDGQGNIPVIASQQVPTQKQIQNVSINSKPSWRETVSAMHDQNPWRFKLVVGAIILNGYRLARSVYLSSNDEAFIKNAQKPLRNFLFPMLGFGYMYYYTEVPAPNRNTNNGTACEIN